MKHIALVIGVVALSALTNACPQTCLSCCYVDSDCAQLERCDVDAAICTPTPCTAHEDCPDQSRCESQTCDTTGACTTDQDCAVGFHCDVIDRLCVEQ